MEGAGRAYSGIGVTRGPAANGQLPDCGADTNDLVWLVHDTLAGAAEVNIILTINPPKRRIYFYSGLTGLTWVHLAPQPDAIVSGGVLLQIPDEAFLLQPWATNTGAVGDAQRYVIEFCKPITKLFVTHPDYGVGGNLVFIASDDLLLGLKP